MSAVPDRSEIGPYPGGCSGQERSEIGPYPEAVGVRDEGLATGRPGSGKLWG